MRLPYIACCVQGELFAQSVLDKIAELMPSHAMADGVLPHRSHDSSPSPPGSGAITPHEGFNARTLPDLPPSIAEEPSTSADGSKGKAATQADTIVDVTASASHTPAPVAHTLIPHSPESTAVADPAAPGVSNDGSVTAGLLTSSLQHCSVELTVPAAAQEPGQGAVHHRRTTWEARRTADGPAAVSDLAAHAVYVLHRSIIQVRPSGSKAESYVRKYLIEVVYQQLWQLTTRFWEGWKVPPARMFEVGMVVEI